MKGQGQSETHQPVPILTTAVRHVEAHRLARQTLHLVHPFAAYLGFTRILLDGNPDTILETSMFTPIRVHHREGWIDVHGDLARSINEAWWDAEWEVAVQALHDLANLAVSFRTAP